MSFQAFVSSPPSPGIVLTSTENTAGPADFTSQQNVLNVNSPQVGHIEQLDLDMEGFQDGATISAVVFKRVNGNIISTDELSFVKGAANKLWSIIDGGIGVPANTDIFLLYLQSDNIGDTNVSVPYTMITDFVPS